MNATSVIQAFVDFVGSNQKWDDDAAKSHLVAKGVPELMAEDAVRFTPIAFGRAFMDGLGVELSNQYICYRADGGVARSGELDQNDVFRTALESAQDFKQHPSFNAVVLSSSEVDGVNQAVEAGSDPKDLVLGPVAVFLEPPTRRGFQIAQEYIANMARAAAGITPAVEDTQKVRPWWKFW